jgi:putative hydrolase of the HAD superfamily
VSPLRSSASPVLSTPMPSANAADLDALTVDAMGTLVDLADPTAALAEALEERGVQASPREVQAAFRAEVEYYLPRAQEGRDDESLRDLARRCAGVFLEHLVAPLDPSEFAPAFVGALEFRPLDGAVGALEQLRRAGLALACVSNWDASLAGHLERAGVAGLFDTVVSSAEAGAPKPDPAVFRLALDRLGTAPERTLHVGDEDADREGAAAAGLLFEPAPLATVPERLGLPLR